MNYYAEELPDDIAKELVGEKYDANCVYQMVNDPEGMYISGYNKETGERVNLSQRTDGIPDDMEISVEEFELAEDAINEKEMNTFSTENYNSYIIPAIISIVLALALLAVGFFLIKKYI